MAERTSWMVVEKGIFIYLHIMNFIKGKDCNTMDLSKASTRELVEELAKREAVEAVTADPYQTYKIIVGDNEISDTGPVVILRIWD